MDVFFDFIKVYDKGDFSGALKKIIRSPGSCYDSLTSLAANLPQLANYADSVVFGDFYDYFSAASLLIQILEFDPQGLYQGDSLAKTIRQEDFLRRCRPEMIDILVQDQIPPTFEPLIKEHIAIRSRIEKIAAIKPAIKDLLAEGYVCDIHPWQFIPYNYPLDIQNIGKGDIPLVYLEPSEGIDYKEFLKPFRGKPVLYVSETIQHFYSLLRHEPICEALMDPQATMYVLSLHPGMQFVQQDLAPFKGKSFAPVLQRKMDHMDAFLPRLGKAISAAISASFDLDVEYESNPPIVYLYHLATAWVNYQKAQRYGKSRCFCLHKKIRLNKWLETYKELPIESVDMGFPPKDYVLESLEEMIKTRKPRKIAPKKKLRVVHVVPQIVDLNHAPSRLLRCLLYNSDRDIFDVSVITTENLNVLPLEYPTKSCQSPPSDIRGQESFLLMKENNIDTWIAEPLLSEESLAEGTEKKLEEWGADIAVFHAPDEVNMMVAAKTSTPLRVLFEHGTPPEYPGFDIAVLSSEAALNVNEEKLKKLGTQSYTLDFCLDFRKMWERKALTKQELGFPSDAFIMTTISNHLGDRLNKRMCMAIGEVLKRCPNAYYAPMGAMKKEAVIRKYLEPYGVNDRVRFLGHVENPSQISRSMDLYLNEFPFGSCIGMLEAMAGGCPVVSMYDPTGPQQARYAGSYFGMDKVITTGRPEDYVDLACKLITDKTFYNEWSKHAKEQYQKHADERNYARSFEQVLLKHVEELKKAKS